MALRAGGDWIDAWNLARWHLAAQAPGECLIDLSPGGAMIGSPPEAAPRLRGLAYTCAALAGDVAALDRLLAAGGPGGLDPAAVLQHAWLIRGRDRAAAAGLAAAACRGGATGALREQCHRVQERL